MGSLEHLWAGWRAAYFASADSDERLQRPADETGNAETDDALSLFERILNSGQPDDETYIVHRGATCFAILNLFPYTNGHLMVLPNRAVASIEDLDEGEHLEFWSTVRAAVVAIKDAFGCDGINLGMNLGRAAGAGVPDHLHMHVLPRWTGDTNFMTAIIGTRVMPETLEASWRKVRDHWPT